MRERRQNKEEELVGYQVSQFQLEKPKQQQCQQNKDSSRLRSRFLNTAGKLLLLPLISFSSWASAASSIFRRRSFREVRPILDFAFSDQTTPTEVLAGRLTAARAARLRRAGFTCGFFVGHNSSISSSVNDELFD